MPSVGLSQKVQSTKPTASSFQRVRIPKKRADDGQPKTDASMPTVSSPLISTASTQTVKPNLNSNPNLKPNPKLNPNPNPILEQR